MRRDTGAGVPNFRVFTVGSFGELTLRNTTVSGGKLKEFGGSFVDYYGGGLFSYKGTLVLANSTVTGNIAEHGGGISSQGGVLILTDSTVSSNTAYTTVGGVLSDSTVAYDAHLRIDNSANSGNYSHGSRGGLLASGGTALITNSLIAQNYAGGFCGGMETGGRSSTRSTATISNSTIAGNTAAGQSAQ